MEKDEQSADSDILDIGRIQFVWSIALPTLDCVTIYLRC